jgi:hypothetical protein
MTKFFGSASTRAIARMADTETGAAASDDAAVTTEVDTTANENVAMEGTEGDETVAIDPQVLRDSDALHEAMKAHAAKLAEALNENTVLMTDLHTGVESIIRAKRNPLEFLLTLMNERDWTEEHLHDFPVPGTTTETCGNGRPALYNTYVPGRKGPKAIKHNFYDMLARLTGDGVAAAKQLADIENKKGIYSDAGKPRMDTDKNYAATVLRNTRDILERALAVFHQQSAVNSIDGLTCELDQDADGNPNPRSLQPIWIYHDVVKSNIKPLSVSEFLALKPAKAQAELAKIEDEVLRKRDAWKQLFATLQREAETDTSKAGQGGGDNASGADTAVIRTLDQFTAELSVLEDFLEDDDNYAVVVKEAAKGNGEVVMNMGDVFLSLKDWWENKGGQKLYQDVAAARLSSASDPIDKAKAEAKAKAALPAGKVANGGKKDQAA